MPSYNGIDFPQLDPAVIKLAAKITQAVPNNPAFMQAIMAAQQMSTTITPAMMKTAQQLSQSPVVVAAQKMSRYAKIFSETNWREASELMCIVEKAGKANVDLSPYNGVPLTEFIDTLKREIPDKYQTILENKFEEQSQQSSLKTKFQTIYHTVGFVASILSIIVGINTLLSDKSLLQLTEEMKAEIINKYVIPYIDQRIDDYVKKHPQLKHPQLQPREAL